MAKRHRGMILLVLFAAIFVLFTARLTQLQLIDGDYYAALANERRSTTLTVTAARGAIWDRNGKVLAGDRAGFSLVLDGAWLPADQTDAVLTAVTELLSAAGESWNSMTAAEDDESRITGIRLAMEKAGFNSVTPFVLASDVSRATASVIEAYPDRFPGVRVVTTPVREYLAGTVAAHLIGTVGPIYAEEYETLRTQGYRLTDTVGKSGIEATLESTLRGTAGTRTLLWGKDGTVLDERETAPAVAGNTVQLTIDSTLQAVAQTALEDTIATLRAVTPTVEEPYMGQDVKSGSALLLDVHTGAVLVAASAPGYDLSTYTEDAAALLEDEDAPLFNRALSGTFPCGSVIKPAVAVAGLTEGVMDADTSFIACDGVYHYYESVGFTPKCLGNHGEVTLTRALQRSCNVYFFDLGRLLGIDRLNRYLTAFGLGQTTGIELSEATGVLASPVTKNGAWVAGDTCQCAIGQMDQRFTPLQLAAYAMTLANNGVRYRAHLVQRVLRYDGSVVSETQPQVIATVPADEPAFAAVRQGMVAVVQPGGTAYAAFKDAAYTLAAKTGTAQNGNNRSDHGVFIAYAPTEDPQVAVAVVMENGTSAPAAAVARTLLDAYFK